MTTTTRGKAKARPPKGDVREQTLMQFDAELNEHAGGEVGFAEAVTDLHDTRAQIAALAEARKELFDRIKVGYANGVRTVGSTSYTLRQTDPGEAELYRAAESATVKKFSPRAWAAARAEVPFVQVKAPGDQAAMAAAAVLSRVPRVGAAAGIETVVAAYKEAPAWELLRGLRDAEQEARDRLDKIAADFGWDGGLDGPLVFSDGWSVQLRRREFRSDRLAEVDPALFDQLAVAKVKQAPARVYVAKLGEDDDGAVDLDGE